MSKKRQINKTKQKKHKSNLKQSLRTMLAMVMVAVVAVVGTLAYLSRKTQVETNTFLGSPNIDVKLTETNWTEEVQKKAKDYTPGITLPKNPVLTNNSKISGTDAEQDELDKVAEWVAIKVSFKAADNSGSTKFRYPDKNQAVSVSSGAAITYGALKTIINPIVFTMQNTFSENAKKWVLIQGNVDASKNITDDNEWLIFMYNISLERTIEDVANGSAATEALFNEIKIRTQEVLESTYGYKLDSDAPDNLPGFDIVVQGAAIKNETKTTLGKTSPNSLITNFSNVKTMYASDTNHKKGLTEQRDIKKALVELFGTTYDSSKDPTYEIIPE